MSSPLLANEPPLADDIPNSELPWCMVNLGTAHVQVLNYGQAIFEGMKAQRTEKGEIVLFRPKENAARMKEGALRMSMVPPDEDLFLRGVLGTVRANQDMVPPAGKGSLYLRPLLLGTGSILGLGTAPSFTFTVFGTPVGSYFKVRAVLVLQPQYNFPVWQPPNRNSMPAVYVIEVLWLFYKLPIQRIFCVYTHI